jgi:glucokinase
VNRVGIDLGGTAIKAGAISDRGEVIARRTIATELERGPSDLVDRIAELARELGAERAIGLGSPGLIDRDRGVVQSAPNLKRIESFPLRTELARRLGLAESAVRIENDANAAAAGEQWIGAARGEQDVLVVTLGTGIGGGLILGGELFLGAGGMAGEIGHIVVDRDGPVCGCGARGCVETLASASAAEARALRAVLPRAKPGDLAALASAARASPGPERELIAAIGSDLGRGLGAAVSLLDVRCFVIGGGFGAALDVLEPGIRAGVRATSYGAERLASVRFLPALLGNDAGWIGAARLAVAT